MHSIEDALMTQRRKITTLNRRDVLLGAGASLALSFALGEAAHADIAPHSADFEATLTKLLAGATPTQGGIEMDLPATVENGDYVPLALAVDSPMTQADHVKAIHLLSTANPRAHVATFRFTLLSGKARVTSRMRLATTQEVVALAEISNGTVLMSSRTVDVKVGGCGLGG